MTNIVRQFRLRASGETEQRAEMRHRTLKGGTVSFFGGYCSRNVIVRSLSPSGARLDLNDTEGVPPLFDLTIGGGNAARTASVRWRSSKSLGVRFVKQEDTVNASSLGR